MGDFNLRCEYFRQKIINDINSCDIPIAPAFYIVEEIYRQMQNTYYETLEKENKEKEEKKE